MRTLPTIPLFLAFLALATSFLFFSTSPCQARTDLHLSHGQVLYVPIYSHIYGGDRAKGREILLTATLSLRNTDPDHPLTFTVVDYYDSNGKLIKKYVDKPLTLAPLASTRFIIKESDKEGGSGANFIVQWQTEKKMHAPLVEAVMIGTKMQQGISYTSRAVVLEERNK